MHDTLLQIGVGGIFAVLVLEKVFNFLRDVLKRKNGNGSTENGTAGNKSVEYWQQYLDQQLAEMREEQRKDVELLRGRFHDLANGQQKIILLVETLRLSNRG